MLSLIPKLPLYISFRRFGWPRSLEPFLESFLYFFDVQGRYAECAAWTGQALAALQTRGERVESAARRRGVGRILALHAAFQFRLGEFARARQQAEEALALLEPLAPLRDIGHARLYLAAAWYGLGDLAQAVAGFLAAAEAYRAAGHDWGIGAALDNAGYLEHLRGNRDAARRHLTAGLAIARQTGSRYLLTGLYDHLATLSAAEGDYAAALAYVAQCRQALAELDRPYIVASLSVSLGQIALQAGDPAAAEEHIGRVVQIARDTGNRLDLARFLLQLGAAVKARGNAAAAGAEAAAIARAIGAEGLLAEAQLAADAISA